MRENEFLPKNVSTAILKARASGVCQLAGRNLEQVPRAVYDADVVVDGDTTTWWHTEQMRELCLARNCLAALPAGIAALTALQVLDVSDNELASIPDQIRDLPALKLLDVRRNRLASIECTAKVTSLCKLVCSENALPALPDDLGDCQPHLAEVAANGNQIARLPSGLVRARALLRLSLAGNHIDSLPQEILSGLAALVELDVSDNRLRGCLSEGIGCCTALKILNMSQNRLEALPPAIGLCASLVELHLGFNALSTLPNEIGLCDALAIVDVHDNKLRDLGEGLPTLQLSLLNLTNNDMSSLPYQLGSMTSLRAMPLAGNPLKTIPVRMQQGPISVLLEHLRKRGPEEALAAACTGVAALTVANDAQAAVAAARAVARSEGLRDLDLSSKGLLEVPCEVWLAGQQLASLDLARNQLRAIDPTALGSCVSVRSVSLQHNDLQSWPLPLSPGSLPALAALNLSHNPRLPAPPSDAFAACADTIRTLDLSGCPSIGQNLAALSRCPNLGTLLLNQCKLSTFPSELMSLAALEVLGLSNNAIEAIPADLSRMSSLNALDLRNNNIRVLPCELALLPLRSLLVEGNILRTINRSVLEKGTPALLQYLKNKMA